MWVKRADGTLVNLEMFATIATSQSYSDKDKNAPFRVEACSDDYAILTDRITETAANQVLSDIATALGDGRQIFEIERNLR